MRIVRVQRQYLGWRLLPERHAFRQREHGELGCHQTGQQSDRSVVSHLEYSPDKVMVRCSLGQQKGKFSSFEIGSR